MNDHNTTIEELKHQAYNFIKERDWDKFHNAQTLGMNLSVEANELLEIFTWAQKDELDSLIKIKKNEISQELADVLFTVLIFCQKYDIDVSTAFKKKMKINAQKYPVEKAKGLNKKYNEI